jgi:uncharacterized protein YjeT (DUF2065 family)
MEDIVALMARMPRETRRIIGLMALATGVVLVWAARALGLA